MAEKRARKARIFDALKQDYETMKASRWSGYAGYDRWFSEPMTNAHFALISTYQDLVPAFQHLYATAGSFPKFYASVKALASLGKAERRSALAKAFPEVKPAMSDQAFHPVAAQ